MGKIIIFYKYIDLENPQEIVNWQKEICSNLNLKGRILIASEGINGTLGGTLQEINEYKKIMHEQDLFKDVEFKESDGGAQFFPRLSVKLKQEIVKLGIDPKVISYKNTGKHLSADEIHNLFEKKSKDLVVLDTRNNFESRVGKFKDAIIPDIEYFRQLPEFIDKNLELFKDKEVLMYCTAGVRCERATAYLKSKEIAKEVYQIDGGIHKYIEKYPDGYYRGKNYVFDGRLAVAPNNDILANCMGCNISYDEYTNCINAKCNKQLILCPQCLSNFNNTCSLQCAELIKNQMTNIRTVPAKVNCNLAKSDDV
ncbi:rhodanese-related sulfurtransferase [Candidatus Dependentiae bacterium]|nr:rhodanese-related sulfurtransferase [Candidatus Dependentiae bacterium]